MHPQVRVRVGGTSIGVDEKLAPLIRLLWRAGLETSRSCQEHMTGKVWLEFPNPQHAEMFLCLAVPVERPASLWDRACTWTFGQWHECSGSLSAEPDKVTRAAGAWEYHVTVNAQVDAEKGPTIGLAISVLFPPGDLAGIVERLTAYIQQAQQSQPRH